MTRTVINMSEETTAGQLCTELVENIKSDNGMTVAHLAHVATVTSQKLLLAIMAPKWPKDGNSAGQDNGEGRSRSSAAVVESLT